MHISPKFINKNLREPLTFNTYDRLRVKNFRLEVSVFVCWELINIVTIQEQICNIVLSGNDEPILAEEIAEYKPSLSNTYPHFGGWNEL